MLIILGHLLSLVPSEVQSRELPPLLPLLFQGKNPTKVQIELLELKKMIGLKPQSVTGDIFKKIR